MNSVTWNYIATGPKDAPTISMGQPSLRALFEELRELEQTIQFKSLMIWKVEHQEGHARPTLSIVPARNGSGDK